MINEFDVYCEFRKSQAFSKNRPYKIPKDWDKHFSTKISQKNREALTLASKFFNTKWNKIDICMFMNCGFELYKSFTYTQFFDPKIIKLYIQKDKHLKRDIEISKESIIKSFKFVKKYIQENNIKNINRYCLKRSNGISLIVEHYIRNKIDKYFVVWMICSGFLPLEDDDRAQMPYIIDNYRKIKCELENISKFLEKLKSRL